MFLNLTKEKIIDLNNSIKKILFSIEIFNNYNSFLNNKYNSDNKIFNTKFFTKKANKIHY